MALVWEKDGEAFYASVTEPAGEMRFRLIVENTADGWNWAVWRPGKYGESVRHGRAATLHGAMWDAELVTL